MFKWDRHLPVIWKSKTSSCCLFVSFRWGQRDHPIRTQGYPYLTLLGNLSKISFMLAKSQGPFMKMKCDLISWRFYNIKPWKCSNLVLLPIDFNSCSMSKNLVVGSQVRQCTRITNFITLRANQLKASICISTDIGIWLVKSNPVLYPVTKLFVAYFCIGCKILSVYIIKGLMFPVVRKQIGGGSMHHRKLCDYD